MPTEQARSRAGGFFLFVRTTNQANLQNIVK